MIHKENLTSFGDPQGSILVPLAGSYTGVTVKKKQNIQQLLDRHQL